MFNKKIRFFWEYTRHYLAKYYLAIVLGAFFGGIMYLQKDSLNLIYQTLQTKNTIVGIEGLYTTSNLPTDIANLISFGLTSVAENEKPITSPIIQDLLIKNNDQEYIFTFVDNLYWHNGKKFDPSDIDINIPGTTTSVNENGQLVINLSSPYSPLLINLNRPVFYKKTLIGLGLYKSTGITYQDGFLKTLKLTSLKTPQYRLTYRFYPNSDDLINAFKLGEIDEMTTDTLDSQLNNWSKTKITQHVATNKYSAVFINNNKFANKQIRQALAYATPKSEDKNNRCLGPISPNSWAYNPQVKEYTFNPTRAKELLDKNKIESINLIVADRKLLKTADKIKSAWEETFNAKVNLTVQNQQLDLENYDAILAYGSIPIDPDQYLFWHSTQANTNITHLNNSRIDKLLEDGRQIQDQVERKKIYADFQRFLLEESPVIFIDFPISYTITREN